MSADDFAEYRPEIEDFENKLLETCQDIIDASNDSFYAYQVTRPQILGNPYSVPERYLEILINTYADLAAPANYDNDDFHHAVYRRDVAAIANGELAGFLDGADLGAFAEIDDALVAVVAELEKLDGYYGFELLLNTLGGWRGVAADNFKHKVLADFEITIGFQITFVKEIAMASLAFHKLVERARGDGLGLAQNFLKKVRPEGGGIPLEFILWAAGTVAATVATFGAAGPVTAAAWAGRAAFGISTATGLIGHAQSLSASGGDEERKIEGEGAKNFIPSCQEQIDKVVREGTERARTVLDALAADLKSDGIDELTLNRPKVIDQHTDADFTLTGDDGMGQEVLIESVANLRFAGSVLLPTMAAYYDTAHGKVAGLGAMFDRGIGDCRVATPSRHGLNEVIATLATAFADSRDHLYEAGVVLTAIADTYFDTEARNEAMMTRFNQQLDEVDTEQFPTYEPA